MSKVPFIPVTQIAHDLTLLSLKSQIDSSHSPMTPTQIADEYDKIYCQTYTQLNSNFSKKKSGPTVLK